MNKRELLLDHFNTCELNLINKVFCHYFLDGNIYLNDEELDIINSIFFKSRKYHSELKLDSFTDKNSAKIEDRLSQVLLSLSYNIIKQANKNGSFALLIEKLTVKDMEELLHYFYEYVISKLYIEHYSFIPRNEFGNLLTQYTIKELFKEKTIMIVKNELTIKTVA